MPSASQQTADSLSLPRSLKTRSTTYVLTELLVQTANANLFVGYNKAEPSTPLVFKRIPRLECTKVEADIHRSLPANPYVIPLLDHITTKEYIFLVLPYYKNGDLFDLVINVHSHEGIPQDVKEEWATNVFAQMVEAVHFLHRHGVYHRDLKPENFLIDDQGRLRIADFGLATTDAKNSALGFGSEFYMGPESFAEQKEFLTTHKRRGSFSSVHGTPSPAKSDVWSLGILLLNLLCGRNPWSRAVGSNSAFADYMRRPVALKEAFGLSESAWKLVSRMLHMNVLKRADIREIVRLFKGVDSWLTVDDDTLASENAQYYTETQTGPQDVYSTTVIEEEEEEHDACVDAGRRKSLSQDQLLTHYEMALDEMEHVLAKSATVGYNNTQAKVVEKKRKPKVHVQVDAYDCPSMMHDDDDGLHSATSSDDEPMTPPATTPVSMADQMEALFHTTPPPASKKAPSKSTKRPVAKVPPPTFAPTTKQKKKKKNMTESFEASSGKRTVTKKPPQPYYSPKESHAPWTRSEISSSQLVI